MFTGKYPTKHGAYHNPNAEFSFEDLPENQKDTGTIKAFEKDPGFRSLFFGNISKLSEENNTLAEILSEHSYRTAGIIGGIFAIRFTDLPRGLTITMTISLSILSSISISI
jgi:arylsulfatase A-like enzyme